MKFLISTTEVHRVDTENEAVMLIEDAKKDGNFILTKYSTEHKEKKAKGEIVEDHEIVDTFTLDTFTFISTLPEKAREYSINEVAFAGPQVYLQGLIKRLQEHELKTYSTNIINYTILWGLYEISY